MKVKKTKEPVVEAETVLKSKESTQTADVEKVIKTSRKSSLVSHFLFL